MRGSLGAVASVRSCAPVEIQEFFGGSLGAKERMFRIGGLKMLPNGRNKLFFELAMNAYLYNCVVYLCKTEALRMRYMGRRFCSDENKRVFQSVGK